METLELLGTALGLGALAGINLYLTVFITGLAIHLGWITLSPENQALAVLGNESIIIIAGLLYALQFFADKVPWVDSLWDLLHSLIRPVGGALLAVTVLGEAHPEFNVIVALLAGGVALSTHTLKAGARLIANSSPEPVSNVLLSVGEDVGVLGGLVLLQTHPVVALVLVVLLVAAILYFGPRCARALQIRLWLAWRRLAALFGSQRGALPIALPARFDMLLHKLRGRDGAIEWAVPCVTAGSKQLPANARGYLVFSGENPGELFFVGKRWFRTTAKAFSLSGCKVHAETRFLSENLVLYSVADGRHEVFYFERGHAPWVEQVVRSLKTRLGDSGAAPDGSGVAGAPVTV